MQSTVLTAPAARGSHGVTRNKPSIQLRYVHSSSVNYEVGGQGLLAGDRHCVRMPQYLFLDEGFSAVALLVF